MGREIPSTPVPWRWRMRRRGASLAVLLLLAWPAVAGCAFGSQAACSRGADSDRVEPERAAPGESFGLHGEGFAGDCYDTGQLVEPPPERGIRVVLRQGDEEWRLATVDAGPAPDYAIDAELAVPEGAAPGRAVVEIHTKLAARPDKVPLRVVGGEAPPDAENGR
jgi:hypothetical protein